MAAKKAQQNQEGPRTPRPGMMALAGVGAGFAKRDFHNRWSNIL